MHHITDIITRGVQLKYGGSVWHQEPGHLLQKCGRPPSLAGQPLQGLPKMQGHSVRQWQQKFADFDGIHTSSLSAVGDRGGGWLYGREDRGGVTGGEDCDKLTVGVVGDVVGEGDEDGPEVGE